MRKPKHILFWLLFILLLGCKPEKILPKPPLTFRIDNVSLAEGNLDSIPFDFIVSLNRPDAGSVSVRYATVDSTAKSSEDFIAVGNGSITFQSNDTIKRIRIFVKGDNIYESDEIFHVKLSSPSSGSITTERGIGTIKNDDSLPIPPKISIDDIASAEGNTGNTPFVFTIALSKPETKAVRISYSTGDLTAKGSEDYIAVTNQLITFQPNETQKKISMNVVGDEMIENDETFIIKLSNPVNCTIEKDSGVATIKNDDVPPSVTYKLSGVCFSPYMDGQNPDRSTQIGEQQIIRLLNKLKYYTNWIRTYGSTDGLEKIAVNAHGVGLKIAQGAWLGRDISANQKQIANLIALGKAGQIDVAIVGSEVLLRNDLTKAQLIAYINQVRTALPNVPVTTADVYQTFLLHPDLVSAVDVIYAHIYPYWEGINISCATNFVDNIYEQLKTKAQGKEIVVAETGWPSAGNAVGKAIPSQTNAASYFLNLISWAQAKKINYHYFEFMDEAWKQIHEGPQGANWGVLLKNGGELKPGMTRVFDGETNPNNWLPVLPLGQPSITFTSIPKIGTSDNLEGQVKGVNPVNYKVAIFIFVGAGWWNKPTWADPLTFIQCDGSFVADISTGGNDALATRIRAYVVPANYNPPQLGGQTTIPASVEQNSVVWIEATR